LIDVQAKAFSFEGEEGPEGKAAVEEEEVVAEGESIDWREEPMVTPYQETPSITAV
jgi:hypothetical protein